jgi:hypothetical protein
MFQAEMYSELSVAGSSRRQIDIEISSQVVSAQPKTPHALERLTCERRAFGSHFCFPSFSFCKKVQECTHGHQLSHHWLGNRHNEPPAHGAQGEPSSRDLEIRGNDLLRERMAQGGKIYALGESLRVSRFNGRRDVLESEQR